MNYLQTLFSGSGGEGFLAVWCKQSKQTNWFPASNLGEAESFLIEQGSSADIYFGWCLQSEVKDRGRGKTNSAIFSPGIMFDADLLSSDPHVHSQSALPKSVGEVMVWLRDAGFPEPTQIRSSGNGLYLDWLHDGGVFLRNKAERELYAASVKSFHLALRTSALERRGWKFDATHDLARVTRMPGTFNHKTNPPKLVEVLS